jgi:UDP-N-acetylglucosamine transferase subunit ALG13
MIFVVIGTEKFPFNRLVESLDRLVEAHDITDEVFVQTGSCTYLPRHCIWKPFISFGEMCKNIESANLVIAHAGAGTTLLCIQLGKWPILVPRQKKFGEHVDDHQVSFAKKFEAIGLASVAYEMPALKDHIAAHQSQAQVSPYRQSESKKQLIQYLESCCSLQ